MKSSPGFLLRLSSLLLLAVLSTTTLLRAQSGTGSIRGRVANGSSGQSLQGAIIRVIGSELRTDTLRDGEFDLRRHLRS